MVHGDAGLAGPWAATVEPGESIGFHGPGGGYAPDPAAVTHLLVGDEAALPAIAAALDVLPEDASAEVFVEVADADHRIPLRETSRTRLTWVHRGSAPYGAPLAAAVRETWVPDTRAQVFVHGNAELVKDLRRFLFVDHRHDRASGVDLRLLAHRPERGRLAELQAGVQRADGDRGAGRPGVSLGAAPGVSAPAWRRACRLRWPEPPTALA